MYYKPNFGLVFVQCFLIAVVILLLGSVALDIAGVIDLQQVFKSIPVQELEGVR